MEVGRNVVARVRAGGALLAIVAVAIGTVQIAGVMLKAQGNRSQTTGPTTVLFMCPHGAAKSVLASAYFQRVAKERGLDVRVESAGTDPDPQIAPAVAKHLAANGYTVPTSTPRRVSDVDMETADVVISIGCDLSGVAAPKGKLLRWDDVPALSDDFAKADSAIRERVTQLLDDLLRQRR